MRSLALALAVAALVAPAARPGDLVAQAPSEALLTQLERARTAAGEDHLGMYGRLCAVPIERAGLPAITDPVPGSFPTIDPAREWYAEPAQVFDDLYFLGQTSFSVWAVRSSEGIILIDAIFDYSVEDEVVDGLRTLGLDPAEIRYVIISHAHGDHVGGAGILQRLGARVVMSEADWDLYEASDVDYVKATRDIVATDSMELTLGDKTLTLHLTPGHTLGTISTIVPVRDNGEPHVAALWGGTLFNFRGSPEDPRDRRLQTYAASAARFRDIARAAGADILLSNHTAYDGSTMKIPTLAGRGSGDAHPYVIGQDAVSRFFTVAEECAIATRMAEQPAAD